MSNPKTLRNYPKIRSILAQTGCNWEGFHAYDRYALEGFKKRSASSLERYENLRSDAVDHAYLRSVVDYYRTIGFGDVPPLVHALIDEVRGIRSRFFIDDSLRWRVISVFNEPEMFGAYADKNLYPISVRTSRQPKTHLRCIDGKIFRGDYSSVVNSNWHECLVPEQKFIIKPSRLADGRQVELCKRVGRSLLIESTAFSLAELNEQYRGNFLIQELIEQSEKVARLHPSSVNTLRMVTLRWKGNIFHLPSFMRIGSGGQCKDNADSGGLCIGFDDNGMLSPSAFDKRGKELFVHPTSGFNFSKHRLQIPNFSEFQKFVEALHIDIPHHDLVSWDIAVGSDGLPVFIEHNFTGALWIYQLTTGMPLFGCLSEDILPWLARQPARSLTKAQRIEASQTYRLARILKR